VPPETEVISCPACKHLLRVPADWLGQTVACPECKATFTAPRRDGEVLTQPVLLTSPPAPPAPPRRTDSFLLLPAFGLMLIGFASTAINGWTAVRSIMDPARAEKDFIVILKFWNGDTPIGEKTHEQLAAENAPIIRTIVAICAGLGAISFLGGLSMLRGKRYWLAQVGCVAASVNLANGCCVPGALFGLWGMLLLNSDEGRAHFAR
jgi:hypothetical protein